MEATEFCPRCHASPCRCPEPAAPAARPPIAPDSTLEDLDEADAALRVALLAVQYARARCLTDREADACFSLGAGAVEPEGVIAWILARLREIEESDGER